MQALHRNGKIVENLGGHAHNFYLSVIMCVLIDAIAVRGLARGAEGVKQHPQPPHF